MAPPETDNAAANNNALVNHVPHTNLSNFSLPPYNSINPALWLKLVEMAFNAFHIDDESQRIFLTISSLPVAMQSEASDAIAVAGNNTFAALTAHITKSTLVPAQQRIKKLLDDTTIGDRKPTQYLRHLRDLAGSDNGDSSIIRSIFLERLPNRITMIIAPTDDMLLDDIAKTADRIHTYMNTAPDSVNNISQLNPNSPAFIPSVDPISQITASINAIKIENKSSTETMQQSITALQQQMATLSSSITTTLTVFQQQISSLQNQRSRNSRSSSRSISRDRDSSICYYHRKFQDKATKCTTPCSYSSKNATAKKEKN